ncbi:tRNA (adenosine(37)-N6)-threonylcarbamoyltransferase complex ATPase subunit type 1 TsaE [Sphingobacterium chuzhouense]|uniref:tRNA threonylcarbamoyladenosine biosynthesis protein TsaE n=1 Tax=Sphingobacterium chuzhouense TaxID=1742264 RepID=A0ABR7XW33_9SPHI|nr:tRNA (adenosine(37)-N6)-threonylcarbamoyltransferase complex ATPase subunit type 1 TsaE [Sphingobacterium chuzhouense]MBD1423224.1 tRNA (adenosine(37)-N6)-threonylcarbamoyltransferase complex ATPase subunit type 1 TsaE [Sphingobacterium chuzhouense]
MNITVNNLQELDAAAKQILSSFPNDRIFLLYGDMGAGKTTFVSSLCKALGVSDSTSSPTFSIVNEYSSPQGAIYHFDFYRLKHEEEALDMGYEEYFYTDAYCFVEWPEKIPNLLPEESRQITLTVTSPSSRTIVIK